MQVKVPEPAGSSFRYEKEIGYGRLDGQNFQNVEAEISRLCEALEKSGEVCIVDYCVIVHREKLEDYICLQSGGFDLSISPLSLPNFQKRLKDSFASVRSEIGKSSLGLYARIECFGDKIYRIAEAADPGEK